MSGSEVWATGLIWVGSWNWAISIKSRSQNAIPFLKQILKNICTLLGLSGEDCCLTVAIELNESCHENPEPWKPTTSAQVWVLNTHSLCISETQSQQATWNPAPLVERTWDRLVNMVAQPMTPMVSKRNASHSKQASSQSAYPTRRWATGESEDTTYRRIK